MGRMMAVLMAFAAVFGPIGGWAIDVSIPPDVTVRIEPGNIITISPVTVLNAPGLPGNLPPGDYSVTFQWSRSGNVLVPITGSQIGGGGNVTGSSVGTEISGVLIESETLFTDQFLRTCSVRVRVRNRTGELKSVGFVYNAFDSAGTGIAFSVASGVVPANSTATLEQIWATTGAGTLSCSRIARFALDRGTSYAFP